MPFLEFVERTSAVFRLSTSSFPFVQPHEGEELVSQPSRQRDGQTYKPNNSNPVTEDLSKSYQATYHEYNRNTINKTLIFVTFKRDHNHSFVSHTFFSLSLSLFFLVIMHITKISTLVVQISSLTAASVLVGTGANGEMGYEPGIRPSSFLSHPKH